MGVVARSQYDERTVYDSDLSFVGDSGITKQSDAKDCDINAIFRRYERTGQLPDLIMRDPKYGDFSSVPSYQDALDIVKRAEAQFAALDVNIRNKFDNDPSKFLAFATDARNKVEMAKMGLLKPEVVEAMKKEESDKHVADSDATRVKAEADERKLIDKIKLELSK